MTSKTSPLPQMRLGADGPLIGAQGLGCMGMSEFYGASDKQESRATLDRALELGITLFDTADMYGMGANEEFLAPFIAANRDHVLIATKFGYARTLERPDDWSLDNRPEFVRASVDRSLQRLGVDTIDLYYMHRRDEAVPLAESVGAMGELVATGKVRWLGLSAVTADELREAHAINPIAALQSEWSIFTRDIEAQTVPAAAELGVTIIPYSPLGRGMLTGQTFAGSLGADDARVQFPRFAAENREANLRLVGAIERVAAALGVSPRRSLWAGSVRKPTKRAFSAFPSPGRASGSGSKRMCRCRGDQAWRRCHGRTGTIGSGGPRRRNLNLSGDDGVFAVPLTVIPKNI